MSTDIDVLDDAPPKQRGLIVRTITLPFRLTAGIIRTIIAVIGFTIMLLLLPIRVAYAICAKVVAAAADVTYGIWRGITAVLRAVWRTVAFVIRTVARVIGGLIRLVLGIIKFPFKLVGRVFRIGTKVGATKAAGTAAATAAAAKITSSTKTAA